MLGTSLKLTNGGHSCDTCSDEQCPVARSVSLPCLHDMTLPRDSVLSVSLKSAAIKNAEPDDRHTEKSLRHVFIATLFVPSENWSEPQRSAVLSAGDCSVKTVSLFATAALGH